MLLLGIDVGTSSVKATLFDSDEAAILAMAGQEYPLHQPALDHAEQNPNDWWDACIKVVRAVMQQVSSSDIHAIGLTGQMHGTVLLDKGRQPVLPAIIWADQRSAQAGEHLAARLGQQTYVSIAGTLPAAGFMASTLYWLAQNSPEALDKAEVVLLPKDYLRWRLTGEIATDVSDAAATGLFDIAAQRWSSAIIQTVGISASIFPPILPSHIIAGKLTADAAEVLGLASGIPVVTGCADQPAQALANGVIAPGLASITIGTGGQVSVPLPLEPDRPISTDARLHVFNHAVPGLAYILGAILAAGLNLRWYRNLLGLTEHTDAYSMLSADAATVRAGADGLLFLPYLMGERTPHMDSLARGAFMGLSARHERAHLARAVMEGVAFAMRQTLEIAVSLSPTPVHTLIGAGGGLESPVWRQILADVIGVPVKKTTLTEQTCLGAAMLAGIGVGAYDGFDDAVRSVARYDSQTEPQTELRTVYDDLYVHYVSLYPLLRDHFHALAKIAAR